MSFTPNSCCNLTPNLSERFHDATFESTIYHFSASLIYRAQLCNCSAIAKREPIVYCAPTACEAQRWAGLPLTFLLHFAAAPGALRPDQVTPTRRAAGPIHAKEARKREPVSRAIAPRLTRFRIHAARPRLNPSIVKGYLWKAEGVQYRTRLGPGRGARRLRAASPHPRPLFPHRHPDASPEAPLADAPRSLPAREGAPTCRACTPWQGIPAQPFRLGRHRNGHRAPPKP